VGTFKYAFGAPIGIVRRQSRAVGGKFVSKNAESTRPPLS